MIVNLGIVCEQCNVSKSIKADINDKLYWRQVLRNVKNAALDEGWHMRSGGRWFCKQCVTYEP